MLVTLSYCPQDQIQAQRFVDWMDEIGSYPNHKLLLFRERAATPIKPPNNFGKIEEQTFIDSWNKWPISTTNAFQSVARWIEHTTKEPFLFLEPDCVCLTNDWLDEIEKEYKRAGKPFMGAYVPQNGDVPEHLSGVSAYPGEVIKYAGQALLLDETAPWDTAVGNMIVAQAHCTDLIQHHWRHPGFKSMDEVRARITSECRLWHSDKSGSLIELLRNERFSPNGLPVVSSDGQAHRDEGLVPNDKTLANLPGGQMGAEHNAFPKEIESSDGLTEPQSGTQNLSRESLTRDTVAILKGLCTAPRYTSLVRKELKRQGVTK